MNHRDIRSPGHLGYCSVSQSCWLQHYWKKDCPPRLIPLVTCMFKLAVTTSRDEDNDRRVIVCFNFG